MQEHVSGTGGGLSIKVGDRIVMAPSGVQKERMKPEDMFVLDSKGNVLVEPEPKLPPHKPPKLSECAPLFMAVRAVVLGCSARVAGLLGSRHLLGRSAGRGAAAPCEAGGWDSRELRAQQVQLRGPALAETKLLWATLPKLLVGGCQDALGAHRPPLSCAAGIRAARCGGCDPWTLHERLPGNSS